MDSLDLYINGKLYKANCNPNTKLSDFIRQHARLKGTKVTCEEGGCGICMVTVTRSHPVTGENNTYAINSCLCPIYSVAQCHITTIEGLGSQRTGFHPLQKNIAAYNGSQCGFCTPGMVMSMYGLFCKKPSPSESEVESSFDGNLCRCTGYRAIFDSAKAFAHDSTKEQSVLDIEELCKFKCSKLEKHNDNGSILKLLWEGKMWYSPVSLTEAFKICDNHNGKTIAFVLGNTATGGSNFDVHIDVRSIKELYKFQISKSTVDVGANLSITELIEKLEEVAAQQNRDNVHKFTYLSKTLAPVLKKIAGTSLRNAGGWAGNLMVKHTDHGFPSDLYTALDALQAVIHVADRSRTKQYTPTEFLKVNMNQKMIVYLSIPSIDTSCDRFQAFKVAPRAVNTLAIVNAAFYLKFDRSNGSCLIKEIRIAYGGLGKKFLRATQTEKGLTGKIFSRNTFKDACHCLEAEAIIDESQAKASAKYRLDIARNLLFLFLKNACDEKINIGQFYLNTLNERPVSSASYEFESKEEKYPYCQPLPKMDSILQASGEAEFIGDKPKLEGELQAVLVLAEVAPANIQNIDYSDALSMTDVHSVITAENMIGLNVNSTIPPDDQGEPIRPLAQKQVFYAGQPVAIVLAEKKSAAETAAKVVKVTYTNIQKPVLDIEEAVQKNYYHKRKPDFNYDKAVGNAEEVLEKCEHVIEGQVKTETQYHFYMENLMSICVPYDDMMDVFITTQYPTDAQKAVATIIGKPTASVNIKTLRLGGGFGGKVTNANLTVALCAMAANTANRPVRLNLSLKDCMKMAGKRFPLLAKYKIGISADEMIESIVLNLYYDNGYISLPTIHKFSLAANNIIDNAYKVPNWKLQAHIMKTDKAPTYAMRAPFQLPIHFVMETIMEHAAKSLKKDPLLYREMHFLKDGDPSLFVGEYKNVELQNLQDDLMETALIPKRLKEVDQFNKNNLFVKKGICVIPTKYFYFNNPMSTFNVYMSVFEHDGTVAITHGGVEMGQGLNTKVVQVAAKELGIEMDKIKVHATASITSPNNTGTFGSLASENVCRTTLEACKILKERMEPYRKDDSISWNELVTACSFAGLDMAVSYRHNKVDNPQGEYAYCIYSASAIEVELDILTGESTVTNVDAIYDIGESANPTIDVGQIEGAMIMGFGFYRTEKEIHDKETGKLLTNGTWKYHPPSAMDIPLQMNIKLRKNAFNEYGVMPSKAIGEPPMLASTAVLFAMKRAIESFREQKGDTNYFPINTPATVDIVQQFCNVTVDDLVSAIPE